MSSGVESYLVRDGASGMYVANTAMLSEEDVLAAAEEILFRRLERGDQLNTIERFVSFLWIRLNPRLSEVFAILFLDASLRMLAYEEMFFGTVSMTAVHPREIVRRCLHHNASHVVIAHNHPSGDSTPSTADKELTATLQSVLRLIDVKVVDHVVVGKVVTSFLASGLLEEPKVPRKRRAR